MEIHFLPPFFYNFCALKHFYAPTFYLWLASWRERKRQKEGKETLGKEGWEVERGDRSDFYLNVDRGWSPSVQTVGFSDFFPAACKTSEEASLSTVSPVIRLVNASLFFFITCPSFALILPYWIDFSPAIFFLFFFFPLHNTWFILSSAPSRFFSLHSRWHLLLLFSLLGIINLLFLARWKASY